MAIILCPECNREVSNQAKQCVHCGYPLMSEQSHLQNTQKENKGLSFWGVVFAVILALVIMSFL